ncbi:3D domain-containing protein [Patescibacteria group bacterium]|nr:3D domain-containing protein [Patescibacteria group bacterium]
MTSNSTSNDGKRPWNQVVVSTFFVLFLVISPISSAQAQTVPVTEISSTVVTSTEVTELPDQPDMRSEIGEPAVIEIVRPDRLATLKTYSISVTGYNSEEGQTDSTPFTTADGSTVGDGIIAANFLPFNTKVRFPELFGDRVFEVHDRMNPRYNLRADVWMANKSDALKFGVKRNIKIEVIEWGNNSDTQWKRIAQENALKRAMR